MATLLPFAPGTTHSDLEDKCSLVLHRKCILIIFLAHGLYVGSEAPTPALRVLVDVSVRIRDLARSDERARL